MVDVITLSVAICAIIVSITTHIKFSKCWGFELQTRTPKTSAPTTPNINNSDANLIRTPLLGTKSEPINIPLRIEPKRVIL